jgi:hypothetical protein
MKNEKFSKLGETFSTREDKRITMPLDVKTWQTDIKDGDNNKT